jgi:hypothetical protein
MLEEVAATAAARLQFAPASQRPDAARLRELLGRAL